MEKDSRQDHLSPFSLWLFVLFPAVAMLLGWGLRGYIGGGPFGAMIPGCVVALCLSLLLRHRADTAAIVALFGTVGIGLGGEMTYGQTLGFLRESDTVLWGLLGTTVKGGVWGFFGGAVLATGLLHKRFEKRTIVIAWLLALVAFYLGIKFINEPKLLYFSNRLDRPRDESWAGLLCAAFAFLALISWKANAESRKIIFQFVGLGSIGGALGFGGGSLWMVYGYSLSEPHPFIGWWKMMEFSFGFILGGFLGLAAYLNRGVLRDDHSSCAVSDPVSFTWIECLTTTNLLLVTYWLLDTVLESAIDALAESTTVLDAPFRELAGMGVNFLFIGGVLLVFGLWSTRLAWQSAVTVIFCHTIIDLNRDLPEEAGLQPFVAAPWFILVISVGLVGFLVWRWRERPDTVRRMFLLTVWACTIVSVGMSYGQTMGAMRRTDGGEHAGGYLTYLIHDSPGTIWVQGVFTVSAIAATWIALACFSAKRQEPQQ